VLTLKWYRQDPAIDWVNEKINYAFTAIFIGEAVIKLLASGPVIYFRDGWNKFDFCIVLLSLLSVLLTLS
jgi:hypothetical protein